MYSSINNIAHKYNIYPFLTNLHYFFNSTFVKKTNYPIISIVLFLIIIILNSIQYYKNNKNYLQNKIINSNIQNFISLQNTILYFYDLFGINSFINNGLIHIIYLILTYVCVSLIELNIGHSVLLFLLLIDMMYQSFWIAFQNAICTNNLSDSGISNSPYCCGSFVLFMSLGFVLYLIQNNIRNIYIRIFIIFVILCVFYGCILYDKYLTFNNLQKNQQTTCLTLTWHSTNFIFGILCALALGN